MLFLHAFVSFIFVLAALMGFVFKVKQAVLLGLALFPWELEVAMRFARKPKSKLVKVLIVVAGILGLGYFLVNKEWIYAVAFLVIESYIYFTVTKERRTINSENSEANPQ